MATYLNLSDEPVKLNTEWDGVRITNIIDTKVGGAVLDVTGFPDNVIESGHVVIYNPTTKVYKPMPLTGTPLAYDSLPSGFQYFGFVIATVLKSRPAVAILTRGRVNADAFKYKITSIASALKSALPHITFN